MSCGIEGESCETPRRRRALIVLAIMTGIFIALSIFSFVKSRGQVVPSEIAFGPYKVVAGKRVFQAYDCMGCHTLVGNGGYLGPDLTEEYKRVGPAWLAAFLPSAGGWPTEGAVRAQLLDPNQQADAGTKSIEDYLKKFPGAAQRIERRGGGSSEMPNLPITKTQTDELIAYLKYTSAMNTEGWPPKVEVEGLDNRLRLAGDSIPVAQAGPVAAAPTSAKATLDPAAHGAQLAKDNGCLACHSTEDKRIVGPGWGGLFNSKVKLADGSTVVANDAYLRESILHPDAQIVAGYPKSVMPDFSSVLTEAEANDIVAYLHTLRKQ